MHSSFLHDIIMIYFILFGICVDIVPVIPSLVWLIICLMSFDLFQTEFLQI